MKKLPVLFGIIIAIIFAGTTFAQVTVKEAPLTWQQAALTDGEELYVELCAVCHGNGAKGDGPAAPAMSKPVPDLTVLTAKNDGMFPRETIENSIAGESRVLTERLKCPFGDRCSKNLVLTGKHFAVKVLQNRRSTI